MLFGVLAGCLLNFVGEQDGERFGEFPGGIERAVDEQTLEECLVELAAQRGRCISVGGFAVLHECAGFAEVGLSAGSVGIKGVESLLGGGDRGRDACLLGLEQLKGDRATA